jgi:hypothetical protein
MSDVTTNVQYVSCLVHAHEDHCTFEQRLGWLLPLLSARLPLVLYACPKYTEAIRTRADFQRVDHPDFELRSWRLCDSETWLRVANAGELFPILLPESRNTGKDTQFFLTLMNAKTELVAQAAQDTSHPFVAFLDAGIAKVFRDPAGSFERLRTLQIRETVRDAVILPGCWRPPPGWRSQPSFQELADRIDWTFCGGFFVLRVGDAEAFYRQTQSALMAFLLVGRLTWEVNVWVQMLSHPGQIRVQWFRADHDDRMTMVPDTFRVATGGDSEGEDPSPRPPA